MTCKRHPYEQGAGVCASCLRERLIALIAAQNDLSPPDHHPKLGRTPPRPLLFPRSVSPYVSHRRSAESDVPDRYDDCFYRTPQARPTVGGDGSGRRGRKGGGRFSLLSSLFGHPRSEDRDPDSGVPKASGSGSWFSSMIHGHRKKMKQSRMFSGPLDEAPRRAKKPFGLSDRGMSPVGDEETGEDVSDSGYSTDSSSGWRRPTPMLRAPAPHHRTGFAFCLSPMVRPSPGRRRRGQASEVGFSGELRSTLKPNRNGHVSGADISFRPNRSRKLADPGRFR